MEQDSDDESEGCTSNTADAGWSMLTSNQMVSSSECPLCTERLRKKKELDDDYACRQALCAPVYNPYNDDDNYGYEHNFTQARSLNATLAHKYHKQIVKNPSVYSTKTYTDYGY